MHPVTSRVDRDGTCRNIFTGSRVSLGGSTKEKLVFLKTIYFGLLVHFQEYQSTLENCLISLNIKCLKIPVFLLWNHLATSFKDFKIHGDQHTYD